MRKPAEQHLLIKPKSALPYTSDERALFRDGIKCLKHFSVALIAIGLLCVGTLAGAQSSNLGDVQAAKITKALTRATAELKLAASDAAQNPKEAKAQHILALALDHMGDIKNQQATQDYPYDAGYQQALILARNNLKTNPRSLLMGKVERLEIIAKRDNDQHLWTFRDAARRYHRAARNIHQRLVELDPNNDDWLRALALNLGKIKPDQVGAEKIRIHYQPALDIHLRLAKRNPSNIEWQRDLANIYEKIGSAVGSMQSKVPAEYHSELEIRLNLFRTDETNTLWTHELALNLGRIGNIINYLGRLNTARDAYNDEQGLLEDLSKVDPNNAQWQNDLASAYKQIASLEDKRPTKYQELVLARYQDALKIHTRLIELDPTNIQWQMNLVSTQHAIANFYSNSGEYEQTLAMNIAAQQQLARFAEQYPKDRGWLFYQLEFYFNIGFEHLRVQRDTRPRIASDTSRPAPDPERFEAASLAGEATFKKMVEIIDVLAQQENPTMQ